MPPRRSAPVTSAAVWPVVAALAIGCHTTAPEPSQPSIQLDPCAERLHDLCGHLLLYCSVHKKLPPTLEELAATSSPASAPLVCPLSKKPYVYDPVGLPIEGRPGRLVLYDPEPTHSGMRWGILAAAPTEGGLITANVILLSERELTAARQSPQP